MSGDVQPERPEPTSNSKGLFRALALLFFVLAFACYFSPAPQSATLTFFVFGVAFELGFWLSLHRALK